MAASSNRVGWRIVVAAAVALTLLFGVQQYFSQPLVRRNLTIVTAIELQAITWGIWLLLLPLVLRLAARRPLEGPPAPGWWIRTLVEGLAIVSLHSVLGSAMRWALDLSLATELRTAVLNGFSAGFASNCLRYAAILLGCHAVAYHRAVRARDRRAAELEADLANARLAQVETCLRPHFLFNTLNSIAALIAADPRRAERMIGELGDLLRESLRVEPLRQVSLAEELAFTEKYIAIEQARFPDRLRVSVAATEEARGALVPHLILQPLIENAVRHGIAPLERGGSIAVAAHARDGRLRLIVSDDGAGVSAAGEASRREWTARDGVGLRGVRARLTSLYGAGFRFELSPREPSGVVASLEIPYRPA